MREQEVRPLRTVSVSTYAEVDMELVSNVGGLADATLRLLLDLVHPILEIRLHKVSH